MGTQLIFSVRNNLHFSNELHDLLLRNYSDMNVWLCCDNLDLDSLFQLWYALDGSLKVIDTHRSAVHNIYTQAADMRTSARTTKLIVQTFRTMSREVRTSNGAWSPNTPRLL